ncbi:hypothetical protein [Planktothrix mougeotii]|uniref:Uncharacterized protein n=1 Tax=Planktothrix mougeotii LEGE 06226 TaxID=1828728 RepID=A0ABR9UCT2_9CYAN|nr:hypothetical protein [Planktothrix mougeotii]MBE9144279.1 hypothetical protein [Planktothrix mougeotii LEGE 06226]
MAKTFLLEGAPYVMRMLGIHERSPIIKDILSQWDDLRHQKADLKQQKKSVENIERKIEQLVFDLSNLLETESAEAESLRDDLLQAVRAKISLHGYRPQSIPFELFQNADDAVMEWMQMSEEQQPETARKEFIIIVKKNQLLFIHAGRPIGCFQHPNYPEKQYRQRGFDRDLEKMLTFNFFMSRKLHNWTACSTIIILLSEFNRIIRLLRLILRIMLIVTRFKEN